MNTRDYPVIIHSEFTEFINFLEEYLLSFTPKNPMVNHKQYLCSYCTTQTNIYIRKTMQCLLLYSKVLIYQRDNKKPQFIKGQTVKWIKRVRVRMFNGSFNIISDIPWWSVLLVWPKREKKRWAIKTLNRKYKIKDWAIQTPQKNGSEVRCSEMVICHVTLLNIRNIVFS